MGIESWARYHLKWHSVSILAITRLHIKSKDCKHVASTGFCAWRLLIAGKVLRGAIQVPSSPWTSIQRTQSYMTYFARMCHKLCILSRGTDRMDGMCWCIALLARIGVQPCVLLGC